MIDRVSSSNISTRGPHAAGIIVSAWLATFLAVIPGSLLAGFCVKFITDAGSNKRSGRDAWVHHFNINRGSYFSTPNLVK